MAGGVNKVILVGNLGKDPEARTFSNGGEVVNFTLATSESWNKDGQRQEKTEWHNIAVFNENHARFAKQYLRKGSKVYLEGQLQTRKWTDNNNQERYTTEVVLRPFRSELVSLSSRDDQGGGGGGRSNDDWGGGGRSSGGGDRGGGSRSASPFNDDLDDDVPF